MGVGSATRQRGIVRIHEATLRCASQCRRTRDEVMVSSEVELSRLGHVEREEWNASHYPTSPLLRSNYVLTIALQAAG